MASFVTNQYRGRLSTVDGEPLTVALMDATYIGGADDTDLSSVSGELDVQDAPGYQRQTVTGVWDPVDGVLRWDTPPSFDAAGADEIQTILIADNNGDIVAGLVWSTPVAGVDDMVPDVEHVAAVADEAGVVGRLDDHEVRIVALEQGPGGGDVEVTDLKATGQPSGMLPLTSGDGGVGLFPLSSIVGPLDTTGATSGDVLTVDTPGGPPEWQTHSSGGGDGVLYLDETGGDQPLHVDLSTLPPGIGSVMIDIISDTYYVQVTPPDPDDGSGGATRGPLTVTVRTDATEGAAEVTLHDHAFEYGTTLGETDLEAGFGSWTIVPVATSGGVEWARAASRLSASGIVYGADHGGDWGGSPPGDVARALDRLAARITALETP